MPLFAHTLLALLLPFVSCRRNEPGADQDIPLSSANGHADGEAFDRLPMMVQELKEAADTGEVQEVWKQSQELKEAASELQEVRESKKAPNRRRSHRRRTQQVSLNGCSVTHNAKISAGYFKLLTGQTVSSCKNAHGYTVVCKSFDYDKNNGVCFLNDKSAADVGLRNSSYDHYDCTETEASVEWDLTAYKDVGNCGKRWNDYQSAWCNNFVGGSTALSCAPEVITSKCNSGVATFDWYRLSVVIDGCGYSHLAQYRCKYPQVCSVFGVPVFIESHRGEYLEDRDGTVSVHQDKGGYQKWEMQRSGDGNFVFIKSHRGEYLEDRDGTVGVHQDKRGYQTWEMQRSDDGHFVYIKSHRGEYLEDRHGTVGVHQDHRGYQTWKVTTEDGSLACADQKKKK